MGSRFQVKFEIILVVAILLSHAYAVVSPPNSLINWFTTDDAFYYFKVAQNITEGHGVSFDGIGRTNGFHPLWMLICIPIFALARFDLILPLRLVIAVLAIFNAATAVILFRLLYKYLSFPVAALAALFWAFFPKVQGVTTTLGMESGVNTFFVVLFLYKIVELLREHEVDKNKKKLWVLGIIGSLTLLSRLDTIFLIIIMGLWVLFPARHVRFLAMGDIMLAVSGVFLAYVSRLGIDLYYFYSASAIVMFAMAVAVKPIIYYLFGLYRLPAELKQKQFLFRIFLAVTTAGVVIAAGVLLAGKIGMYPRLPRAALLLDWLISLPLAFGWRLLASRIYLSKPAEERVTPLEGLSFNEWRAWLPSAFSFFGPVLLTLLVYMTWNFFYFGTPSPVSGQIKQWWGTMMTVYGTTARSIPDILGITSDPDLSPWSLFVHIPFAPFDWMAEYSQITEQAYWGGAAALGAIYLLIIFLIARSGKDTAQRLIRTFLLVPLFVGSFLQTANYKMSGYISLHTWYWIPQMVCTVIFWAILLEIIVQKLKAIRVENRIINGASVVLGILILFNFLVYITSLTPWEVKPGEEYGYLGGAVGLQENTEPGSIIGSTGGGVIAYFTHDRTIVNMDGLISSYPYFQMLKSGQGAAYLDKIGLDYVYGGEYVIKNSEPYVEMFRGRLKYLKQVAGSALFRYLPAK